MHKWQKQLAGPWKTIFIAFLFLGLGLGLGAGVALFFAEKPAAPKILASVPAPSKALPKPANRVETLPAPVPAPMPVPQWMRNAMPAPEAGAKPMIAVILDDLGPNQAGTEAAIDLPPPITLAFLPYAENLPKLTAKARAAGHELLVHVPMEPDGEGGEDPGPQVLLTRLGPDEVLKRLRWDLDRFDHYVGINNHMGSKFTKDPARLAIVFKELKKRGLLFIDSRTTAETAARRVAEEIGVPFAERQVFLDNIRSIENLRESLAELEALARKGGSAIAIGHPHGITLKALREWLPSLEGKGFALVPVSAIVRRHLEDPDRRSSAN